jgi:hypothetical protein
VGFENNQTKEELKKSKKNKSGGSVLEFSPEQLQAFAGLLMGGASSGNEDQTTTQTNVIQLTPAAARQLLSTIAEDVQFAGKFSKEDISSFVEQYNKAANEQLDKVVRTARQRIQEGKGKGDTESTITSIVTREFPQFFNPKAFAEDYIWSKINFEKEEMLGAKSLAALQKARSLVNDYGKYILSDAEMREAAKNIARGKMTEGQFKAQLGQLASLEYPELAEKIKAFPDYTVRQLYGNKINLMAKVLELDPNEIQLDNPVLDRIKNMTVSDANRYLATTPEIEGTVAENEKARDAATSLARAMGYGV